MLSNWLFLCLCFVVFPITWLLYFFTQSSFGLIASYVILIVLPWLSTGIIFLEDNSLLKIIFYFLAITVAAGIMIGIIDPGIKNPWYGIWWAFETITTVGYGDIVPENFIGQAFAILYMILGVGLMAKVTASFTLDRLSKSDKSGRITLRHLSTKMTELQDELATVAKKQQTIINLLKKEADKKSTKTSSQKLKKK